MRTRVSKGVKTAIRPRPHGNDFFVKTQKSLGRRSRRDGSGVFTFLKPGPRVKKQKKLPCVFVLGSAPLEQCILPQSTSAQWPRLVLQLFTWAVDGSLDSRGPEITSSVLLAVVFLRKKEGRAAEGVVVKQMLFRSGIRKGSVHGSVNFSCPRFSFYFLSLKVSEGCVDRPLAYEATMLTMLDNENISAFSTSCTRAWLAPMTRKQISP